MYDGQPTSHHVIESGHRVMTRRANRLTVRATRATTAASAVRVAVPAVSGREAEGGAAVVSELGEAACRSPRIEHNSLFLATRYCTILAVAGG